MLEPTSMSPGSIMPAYPWLFDDELNTANTATKINAMRNLGVPYEEGYEDQAVADLTTQAEEISKNLADAKIKVGKEKEIIALIAYLQRLGTDIKNEATVLK
jgi:cytochrome c oxidase cbb3-type subunit I/II